MLCVLASMKISAGNDRRHGLRGAIRHEEGASSQFNEPRLYQETKWDTTNTRSGYTTTSIHLSFILWQI